MTLCARGLAWALLVGRLDLQTAAAPTAAPTVYLICDDTHDFLAWPGPAYQQYYLPYSEYQQGLSFAVSTCRNQDIGFGIFVQDHGDRYLCGYFTEDTSNGIPSNGQQPGSGTLCLPSSNAAPTAAPTAAPSVPTVKFASSNSGPCTISTDGQCAYSPNYPSVYGNYQSCVLPLQVGAPTTLSSVAFSTENGYNYDYLTVGGVRYYGTSGQPPSKRGYGSRSSNGNARLLAVLCIAHTAVPGGGGGAASSCVLVGCLIALPSSEADGPGVLRDPSLAVARVGSAHPAAAPRPRQRPHGAAAQVALPSPATKRPCHQRADTSEATGAGLVECSPARGGVAGVEFRRKCEPLGLAAWPAARA